MVFLNTPPCVTTFLALTLIGAHVVLLDSDTAANLQTLVGAIGAVPLLCPSELIERFANTPASARMLVDIDMLLEAEPSCIAGAPISSSIPDYQTYVYHCTSGTTDCPKVVVQSQHNLINGAQLYCGTYGITLDDALLVAVPFSHSFGLVAGLAAALLGGARLLLLDRFVPVQVLSMLEREGVTIVIGTPWVYELLLSVRSPLPTELPTLRVALSSGAPVPQALGEHFARCFGTMIYEVYGSTETGIIAAQWPRPGGWPTRSVGKPLDGVRVRIIGESGSDVPTGSTGQLMVQTPAMFLGYLAGPQAGGASQEWYETGDLAWQNAEGDLFLVGRSPLLIRYHGHTINPIEVETVLLSHPQVQEALVYANEVLCAAVVAEDEVTADVLLALCRAHLISSKVPESIIFVSELPKGELGKLRRVASGIRSF